MISSLENASSQYLALNEDERSEQINELIKATRLQLQNESSVEMPGSKGMVLAFQQLKVLVISCKSAAIPYFYEHIIALAFFFLTFRAPWMPQVSHAEFSLQGKNLCQINLRAESLY